jgi:SagB-type dehydrogenase family enzyme
MVDLVDVVRLLDGRHSVDEAIAAYGRVLGQLEAERRERFASFGIDADERWPASRLFHAESAIFPGWTCPLSEEDAAELTLGMEYRSFPAAPRIALPAEVPAPAGSLADIVRGRRSAPVFSDEPLEVSELSVLLQLACGVTDATAVPPRRAAPSPGALYPLEAYVLALAVEGLERAVYHYAALDHELERLHPIEDGSPLTRILQPGLHDATPAAMIVLTAVLPRVQRKYGERGYRFAHLEAGHIGQNLSLVATTLSLASRCIGGFWDEGAARLLHLVPGEVAVYGCLLGRPSRSTHPPTHPNEQKET